MLRWLAVLALAAGVFASPRWILGWRYSRTIVTPEEATRRPVAIVFGAGLRRDGTPTTVLADRVDAAVDLYRMGKVERLLMTGSVRAGHDEPSAMADRARAEGVPAEAILRDPGGVRTFESCARARDLFGVRSAIVVSQRFHLPRALALCRALGVDAVGVSADRSPYSPHARRLWELREYPASFVALLETLFSRPGAARLT